MAIHSEAHRSLKRLRASTTMDDIEKSLSISQSQPWFEDGNIILEAQSRRFRVHRSVMAQHSQVFSDMFSLAKPSGAQEDGCPIIQVFDNADEIKIVLEWMYHLGHRQEETTQEHRLPYHSLFAYINIGTKYEIARLRRDAVWKFRHDFPSTLADWDKRCQGLMIEYSRTSSDFFALLALARRHLLLDVLPTLLYVFTQSMTDVRKVYTPGNADDNDIQIQRGEERRILHAHSLLVAAQTKHTVSWLTGLHDTGLYSNCTSPQSCQYRRLVFFRQRWTPTPPVAMSLCTWEALYEGSNMNLCSACVVAAQGSHNIGRQYMWDNLPSFFDLPPWKELKKHS